MVSTGMQVKWADTIANGVLSEVQPDRSTCALWAMAADLT